MSKVNKTQLPVKKKTETPSFDGGNPFSNALAVPKHIKEALDNKGWCARFVSAKKVAQSSGGSHPKGWQVVNMKDLGIDNTHPVSGNVDNVFRVGDLILAAKTKEATAIHKNYLNSRAKASSQAVNRMQKDTAKLLKEKIRTGGASDSIKIIEGYDED